MMAELELFLENNPDLKEELENFEFISLKTESNNGPGSIETDSLKFEETPKGIIISEKNFELFCISFLENDLDEDQITAFQSFLYKNKNQQKEFKKFRATKLKKDNSIIFPAIKEIKRKNFQEKILSLNHRPYFIMAASILLLLGIALPIIFHNSGKQTFNPGIQSLDKVSNITIVSITLDRNINIPERNTDAYSVRLPQAEPRYKISSIPPLVAKEINYTSIDINLQLNPYYLALPQYFFADIPDEFYAINKPKQNNPPLKRVFNNLKDKIKNVFSPADEIIEFADKEKITFWDIADSGIKGYNLLTNNDYQLIRQVNEEGKTKTVRIVDAYENHNPQMQP